LLTALCDDFIKHGYDLKHLPPHHLEQPRTINQSAQTNASNRTDTANFASFYLKRLPAEVLVDALNQATGGSETYPPGLYLPPTARAVEVAGQSGMGREAASLQYAFLIFGRPSRDLGVQCDCERDSNATVVQALFLANHPRVREKIARPWRTCGADRQRRRRRRQADRGSVPRNRRPPAYLRGIAGLPGIPQGQPIRTKGTGRRDVELVEHARVYLKSLIQVRNSECEIRNENRHYLVWPSRNHNNEEEH